MTRLAAVLLLAVTVLVSGCSTGLKLAYDNLERIALWQLDEYVTLDDAQKAAFRREFAALKAWHRAQQLPQYVTDLTRLADAIDRGEPAGAAVLATLVAADAHAQRVWDEARPGVERLLALLDDPQIAEYDARLRKRIAKAAREAADDSPAERREDWIDGWHDEMKPWLGRLNAAQKAVLDTAWTAEQPFLRSPEELAAVRLAGHARFVALLASRRQPDLTARLRAEADAREQARGDAARARERALIVRLFEAADADQRRHFSRAVRKLAGQLDELLEPAASVPAAAA